MHDSGRDMRRDLFDIHFQATRDAFVSEIFEAVQEEHFARDRWHAEDGHLNLCDARGINLLWRRIETLAAVDAPLQA